jgi:predicted MFS family arabinose efflux permease
VQLLDGVGAGLIGALFPVVVADLTRGCRHFAAAQGVVSTVHAIGGVISVALAGQLVVWAGYDATFLTLAAIAALGAVLFWLAMPEPGARRRPRPAASSQVLRSSTSSAERPCSLVHVVVRPLLHRQATFASTPARMLLIR